MREKTSAILILLTFIGMVGLYVLLWKAYQIYQQQTAKGTIGGLLAGLAGGP